MTGCGTEATGPVPPLVVQGDARALPLPDESVHAIVCDPPYELAFMSRTWDSTGVAFDTGPWREALRVLKPGGHMAVFGAPRTYHRVACAIEDAGFEMRDSIMSWVFGSGFAKAGDLGKAMDKAVGATRKVVGYYESPEGTTGWKGQAGQNVYSASQRVDGERRALTAPATEAARAWTGWSTQLKPAHEPILLARKPMSGTVAATVLAHDTGAINVSACRVRVEDNHDSIYAKNPHTISRGGQELYGTFNGMDDVYDPSKGRWPANVVLAHAPELDPVTGEVIGDACADGCVPGCHIAALNEQSGTTGRTGAKTSRNRQSIGDGVTLNGGGAAETHGHGDSGGASRFYPTFRYEAKAPTWQRPQVDGRGFETVKPLDLMRWLVRLLTPPGGLVLDMFPGTGTTGQAAQLEGFRSVLVELEAAHLPFIRERLAQQVVVDRKTDEAVPVTPAPDDALSLFDVEAS